MYTNSILAVSGALLSVVAAVPMAKRDIVWVTEIQEDIVTVPVTETVWVNPYATASSHYGHHWHSKSTVTSHVQSTITVSASPASSAESSSSESTSEAPAPSSVEVPTTSSVYVAPTTSSTSEYVAPTTSSVYVAPTTSSVHVAPTTTSSVYVAPTTSSVYVAPTTTSTSEYVAPTTSSTPVYVAPTTTSAAPVASTSAASSSGSGSGLSSGLGAAGSSYTGDMTWYADGLGACGWTNGPSDHIVAVSHIIFDSYAAESTGDGSNGNPVCGKYVNIVGVDGSTYSAEIVDRCVGCAEGDLDLSEDFFNTVTSDGNGRVHDISWTFA